MSIRPSHVDYLPAPSTGGGYSLLYSCPNVPGATHYKIYAYKYQSPFPYQATTLAVEAPPFDEDDLPERPAGEHWAFCCGASFNTPAQLTLVLQHLIDSNVTGWSLLCEMTVP